MIIASQKFGLPRLIPKRFTDGRCTVFVMLIVVSAYAINAPDRIPKRERTVLRLMMDQKIEAIVQLVYRADGRVQTDLKSLKPQDHDTDLAGITL
jgi:hypothetical protein